MKDGLGGVLLLLAVAVGGYGPSGRAFPCGPSNRPGTCYPPPPTHTSSGGKQVP